MDLCSCEEKENGELLCFVNSGKLENRAGDLRGFRMLERAAGPVEPARFRWLHSSKR